jgi:hypothetical protein
MCADHKAEGREDVIEVPVTLGVSLARVGRKDGHSDGFTDAWIH